MRTDRRAVFRSRPNRFVVEVEMDKAEDRVLCHLHDPGRLREILVPGTELLLRYSARPGRKTDWDVVAGRAEDTWVLINSSHHRAISQMVLEDPSVSPFGPLSDIRPEVKVGRSRLDFLVIDRDGRPIYIEVKGCSLTLDRRALFPDAPTERGRRHLEELIDLKGSGTRAALMVLVTGPGADCFSPNGDTDPAFAEVFNSAVEMGVEVYPMTFDFDGSHLSYGGTIPLCGNRSEKG